MAEGGVSETYDEAYGSGVFFNHGQESIWFNNPKESFENLWKSINGAASWDADPWVWAVTFKRLTP